MTPEQEVLRHLAERQNAKRKLKRSARRPAPVFAIVLLGISVAAGAAGIMMPNALDSIESIDDVISSIHIPSSIAAALPKISIGFLGQASAAEKEAAKKEEAKKTDKKAEAATDAKGEVKPDAAKKSAGAADSAGDKTAEANPDLRQWTSEEMSFFKRLNDRKVELDRREAELTKLEEELQKQRLGIEGKIKQLETMRAEISETLKGRVEQDKEKVAKLVDVYSNMKPTSASRIIETLNEDLAMTVLDRMKKKNAAEILNSMSPAKAKKLSEMLTGYREPASAKAAGQNSEAGESAAAK